jgi:hypothetical protein
MNALIDCLRSSGEMMRLNNRPDYADAVNS